MLGELPEHEDEWLGFDHVTRLLPVMGLPKI